MSFLNWFDVHSSFLQVTLEPLRSLATIVCLQKSWVPNLRSQILPIFNPEAADEFDSQKGICPTAKSNLCEFPLTASVHSDPSSSSGKLSKQARSIFVFHEGVSAT
jgi:hypothetical protein